MIEIIGWLGAILFSVCAVPQVIKVYKTKRTKDLSMSFLIMWLWGEILSLIYITNNGTDPQWPIIMNYVFNIIITAYLVIAKIKYK